MIWKKKQSKTSEKLEEERIEAGRMRLFFDLLWAALPREKHCSSCGVRIYGENKSIYWDHLIEWSKRPDLKYEEGNMYFCCFECHQKKSNGFPTEAHKAAIEEAKLKFKNQGTVDTELNV